MGNSPLFIFRQLLPELERGAPVDTDWLLTRGLTAKHAARLAEQGWLKRLGRGVYLQPGDKLDRDACLVWLAKTMPGLHVGGKTALDWRGVRHNLSVKETLTLWGDVPGKLPTWFTEKFPAHYQTTHLFDAAMPADIGIGPVQTNHHAVMASTPERALLELLSDVGKRQGIEEARNLTEGVRTPRLNVLEKLFAHLTRIKVARLAFQLARELDLSWQDVALTHAKRLGGGKRWVSHGKTGERLNLKLPK